jgi:hypothetical protein
MVRVGRPPRDRPGLDSGTRAGWFLHSVDQGALCRCGVPAGGPDHQASVLPPAVAVNAAVRRRSGSRPVRGFHGVTRA